MNISDIFDKKTMDSILSAAEKAGISAKDVNTVLNILTDETKAPTRSVNSQGELLSLLSDDQSAIAADISEATGVKSSSISSILTMAAPFLLKYLLGSNSSSTSDTSGNSMIGSLLGSLVGGGSQQQTQSNGLDSIMSMLGGGSQQQQAQGGGLDSIMSMLGGGNQQPSATSLLSSLLGSETQQTQQVKQTKQTKQTQQSSNQNVGGNLLNSLFNLLGDND